MPDFIHPLPWTIRGCRELATELGLRPSRKLGQNFLPSRELLDRIVEEARVGEGDAVLEVGPGLGHLTDRLLAAGARVAALELDHRLADSLARRSLDPGRLMVVQGDALDGTHRLGPELTGLLEPADMPVSVVSNLPYSVASPLLALLVERGAPIAQIVALVQKEVGDRLCAGPGEPDYGGLSVVVAYHATVEPLFEVPAAAFWPRPEVRSVVVRLTPRAPELPATDPVLFGRLVRGAFGHRRKTVSNALRNSIHTKDMRLEPAAVQRYLTQLGHPAGVRAERLSVGDLVRLANHLRESAGKVE